MSDHPDRARDLTVVGAVGAALCCGLPVLLAAGAGITILGVGLKSWVLVLAGLVAGVAGYEVWRRRRDKGSR